MTHYRFGLLAGSAALAFALVTAACGGSTEPTAATIRVELGNWFVEPSAATAPAGRITFEAVHLDDHGAHDGHGAEGGLIHELSVARRLPDGTFEVIDRVADIEPGQSRELTLALEPGDYELQCNFVEEVDGEVVAHYAKGMRAPFRVVEG